MNRQSTAVRRNSPVTLLLLGAAALAAPHWTAAQVPVDEYGQPLPALENQAFDDAPQAEASLGTAELEDLVGPVALYPDDLLAIVLPASTYPLEIVQAARFLDDLATDSSLEPDESWDESVVALLNYPEVVYMMDKEIDWTWRLGEAVINQQADVLAAVESFRDRAYAAGNLKTDERQTVTNDDGMIEIDPVDEEIIYVPYYEPEEVVVYQRRPVYYYYPYAYPVYYYPYPVGYSFASGYFWGVTTAFTIGWHNHYLHVYHPSYWGHPYYGRYYYGHYYRRPSISVYNTWYVNNSYRQTSNRYRDGDNWHPRQRSGARPATQRVRNYHGDSRNHGGHRIDAPANIGVRQQTRNGDRTRTASTGSRRTATNGPVQRSQRTTDRAENSRSRNNSSSSRQQLSASNSHDTASDTRVQQYRQVDRPSQRLAPPRTDRATHTAGRQVAPRQSTPSEQRATRAAAERPASTQRQAPRPAAQHQAPTQHSAGHTVAQRQATTPARSAAPARQSGGSRSGNQLRTRPRN